MAPSCCNSAAVSIADQCSTSQLRDPMNRDSFDIQIIAGRWNSKDLAFVLSDTAEESHHLVIFGDLILYDVVARRGFLENCEGRFKPARPGGKSGNGGRL